MWKHVSKHWQCHQLLRVTAEHRRRRPHLVGDVRAHQHGHVHTEVTPDDVRDQYSTVGIEIHALDQGDGARAG